MGATTTDDLLARIEKDRGVVHPHLAVAARYSPAALEQFHASYMHAVHENEVLPRITKELIMIAADAAVSFTYGLRFHIGEALRHGASVEQIVNTLELAGLVGGFHVPMAAFPILEEVLRTEEFAGLADGDDA
ncbi:alkylhydroperoxidase/carboxymuconolactone decarboxylase family protein YurZ [Microbacterium sp. AG1240]|uniref:carboxymuconolactone decarboxylase family protein n=1 Tax=Microbacterium sp. AG1240 TaxID=2183992 RepID=UPI000EAECB8C|nr:carboxymuconolactone decarboxylase family protein [Microbacterium sp. AG1240]RKT31470.1 alkylhydroperoxidase/carboxymuconolactone decarboxylase family protein YurZ [Microbacterium sp. AG1240]